MFEHPQIETLSIVLGYLSSDEGLDIFVSSGVGTNWRDPHGDRPYVLHYDQVKYLYL